MDNKPPDEAIRLGDRFLCAQKWPEARNAYAEALRLSCLGSNQSSTSALRLSAAAHIGLGRVYLAERSVDRAIIEFKIAQQELPESWEPIYWQGCARGWSGDCQEAEELFTLALQANPESGCIYVQRGHARFRLNQLEAALTDYLASDKRQALTGANRLVLAQVLFKTGRLKDAQQVVHRFLKEHPDNYDAMVLLGSIQEKQERFPDACVTYAQAARIRVCQATTLIEVGRRKEAIKLLKVALRRQPNEWMIGHALGLAMYFSALSSNRDNSEEPSPYWEDIIAVWVAVSQSRAFKSEWISAAERRYQAQLPDGVQDSLCRQIVRHLQETMSAQNIPTNPPFRGELLIDRELKAASILEQVGGFIVRPHQTPLVCGPLMINFLGAERAFGEFAGQLDAIAEGRDGTFVKDAGQHFASQNPLAGPHTIDPLQRKQLKIYFSELGFAQTLFDSIRIAEVLPVILDLRCPRCRMDSPENSESNAHDGLPMFCSMDCRQFETYNPGYAGSGGGRRQFRNDAVELLIETHLNLAESALTSSAHDVAKGGKHWQRALRAAQDLGSLDAVRHRVVQTAIGRASALQQARKLDEAVCVLDEAVCAHGEAESPDLSGRLSEALTIRGIAAGNDTPPRWEAAVTDLERATELNPHAAHPLQELAVASRVRSRELAEQGDSASAVSLLQGTVVRLQKGIQEIPHTPRLDDEVRETRDSYGSALVTRADELASIGQLEGAISECRQALDTLSEVLLTGEYRDNAVIQIALIRQKRAEKSLLRKEPQPNA